MYTYENLNKEDSLYGEDRLSQFKDQRIIEMYIRNVDGFGGDEALCLILDLR